MKMFREKLSRSVAVATMSFLVPFVAAQAAQHAAISIPACEARRNDSTEKLLECIQQQALWNRLSEFQKIADANPGPDGHGNRDTGTSGYYASVNYVASLMRQAGYQVTIQSYPYRMPEVTGAPQFSLSDRTYAFAQEWFLARLSDGGNVSAAVQPVAESERGSERGSESGCFRDDFAGFIRGNVALLKLGTCAYDKQVENAAEAGASAVILYNDRRTGTDDSNAIHHGPGAGIAFQARLTHPSLIPVVTASHEVGADLLQRYANGNTPVVHLNIQTQPKFGVDYNLIAESPYGNPNQVVVIDAHLDSIYGAGMLDNASGSTTAIEIALNMANTPTRNRLRYIWFGGEELGLFGSAYYTQHLSAQELNRIAFDIDIDVTATPNFDYLVADPTYAPNVKRFPRNVVPQSKVGNQFFEDFFSSNGVPARSAWFGNEGTDSNSFSLVGVPNTGILTQQDCCKAAWEVRIWGGVQGNYEGNIPSFDGGCVDYPNRWCDNLSNNDPNVFELASKAAAYATFNLANYQFPSRP